MTLGWRFVVVASLVAMCATVLPNVRFATAGDDPGGTGGAPAPAPLMLVVTNR
ncbi:MAG: hypothetical protein RL383_328 [Actinomycetota bacterium]|jgi:hypothetical protein